jgi:tRNA (uracil-5-)-methyltransferase
MLYLCFFVEFLSLDIFLSRSLAYILPQFHIFATIIAYSLKQRSLGKEKSRTKIEVYPWILQQRCIDVQPIVAAPTPLRNKCEFTFGYQYLWPSPKCDSATQPLTKPSCGGDTSNLDLKGVPTLTDSAATEQRPLKIPAVGFMVTGWAGGVSFSNSLQNIPNEAGVVVSIVNDFLAESKLAPYDCTTHRGFWRILTLRTSRRTQECMIIIQHNSPSSAVALVDPELGTSANGEGSCVTDWTTVFATEKARLISLLVDSELPTESSLPPVKVTSIFFQEFSGLSNPPPEHPVQVRLLWNIYGNRNSFLVTYSWLLFVLNYCLACLWEKISYRAIRKLHVSNFSWSVFPS